MLQMWNQTYIKYVFDFGVTRIDYEWIDWGKKWIECKMIIV